MGGLYDDDFEDGDGDAPWALGADDDDGGLGLGAWDDDLGDEAEGTPSSADDWLDAQLTAAVETFAAAAEAPAAELPPVALSEGDVVLRRPAPARVVRRRRADPEAAADLPAAAVPGYLRDRRGTWRYAASGASVPGARDVTLRALYRFPVRKARVLVPLARIKSDRELGWCRDWQSGLTTAVADGRVEVVVPVPVAEWERRADVPIGLWAPELEPQRLLDVAGVARLLGVNSATVTAYLSRGRMPQPVARLGSSPVWSRPVIHHWLSTRPGQGRSAASA